jgi:hypothetical protein
MSLDLKASSERAMNNCAREALRGQNKMRLRFVAGHNPA